MTGKSGGRGGIICKSVSCVTTHDTGEYISRNEDRWTGGIGYLCTRARQGIVLPPSLPPPPVRFLAGHINRANVTSAVFRPLKRSWKFALFSNVYRILIARARARVKTEFTKEISFDTNLESFIGSFSSRGAGGVDAPKRRA